MTNRTRWSGVLGSGTIRRSIAPASAVAVLVILVMGAGAAAACSSSGPPPYTVLATIPLVDAIAANSSTVFVQGVTNCSDIWAISTDGNLSLYATVPVKNSACDEGALVLAPNSTYVGSSGNGSGGPPPVPAESPGYGGWGHHGQCGGQPSNTTLFDVVEGRLFAITDNGTNVTLIDKFPISHKPSENMGLAWDQVGAFNHDLIVTSSSGGNVWLVNATGVVTLLAQLHTYIGGPAVAPMSFGPFGGDVIIAEKYMGTIVAVSPTGNVTNVTSWTDANAVTFPSAGGYGQGGWGGWGSGGGGCGGGCSFGPDHDVMFVANYSSGAVEAFPASDLCDFYGEGFIAGGLDHGIAAFASNGQTTLFLGNTERLSDISSIYCPPHSNGGHHQHW